jgi:benzylsuccinate CoA-transferase BbsF subunit
MVPVNTPAEFVRSAQTRVRGYFRATGFPHLADAPFAPLPCNLGRTPASLRRPAPAPGDDARDFPRRAPASPGTGGSGPVLGGLRVISFGVGAVVPELCRTLAELGAEVIKVESNDHPDFLRRLTVEPEAPNRSWMFNDENRGQRSVCLDLRAPRGRELALALCARADVVAENRQGGVVRRWGLDYPDVRRVRPDVIYVASQGYGRGGPLGEAPAFGPLNAAFAGATYLWNHPDAPYPAGSSLEHPDHLAGRLLVVAVLAALEHRRRSGQGQRIEMAQTEATAYLMGEFYLEGPCTGRPPRPSGNAVPWACPHGVYPSAGTDRWCAIAVVGDDGWDRFRAAVGWPAERRLARLAGRLAARAELDARVAEWTAGRPAEDVAAMLQAVGVSAMAVQSADDHRRDPHLAARRAIVEVEDPEVGSVRHVANPLRLERTPLVAVGPAPRLGADTGRVLRELLGLTPAEVRRLVADGVCR